MKSLRRKMFWLLFISLSLLMFSLCTFMGVREYNETRNQVQSDLMQSTQLIEGLSARFFMDASDTEDTEDSEEQSRSYRDFKERFSDPAFIATELPVYVLFLNTQHSVSEIVYYNSNGEDVSQVYDQALSILKEHRVRSLQIGNLFTSPYAWYLRIPNTLTIIPLAPLREGLYQMVILWVIVFGILLLLVFWLSRILVSWMIAPIEDAFNRQKQFIADASHELKTPLAVIYSNTQAFEKEPDSKWINNIQSETERMSRLVSDLLDLTRMEQVSLVKERVDLSSLVQKEVLSMEAYFFEKGISLEEDIEEDIFIQADADRIRQLIVILLDNALHHADKLVHVELRAKGHDAILRVENDGDEISPEDQIHIFERFYRSEKSRNRNDNRYGLGLAIAKNIVDQHQASIEVFSGEGRTEFTLIFKRASSKQDKK